VVLLGVIGDKARATRGRTLERFVWGRGITMLVDGVMSICGPKLGSVANTTDLGWRGHGRRGEERRRERSGLRLSAVQCQCFSFRLFRLMAAAGASSE
jgi:hypothetical protein